MHFSTIDSKAKINFAKKPMWIASECSNWLGKKSWYKHAIIFVFFVLVKLEDFKDNYFALRVDPILLFYLGPKTIKESLI